MVRPAGPAGAGGPGGGLWVWPRVGVLGGRGFWVWWRNGEGSGFWGSDESFRLHYHFFSILPKPGP